MKMFTIPFTETTIHFGRAWSTLSSVTKGTDRDDFLPDARVGSIAMRLVKADTVISAAAVSLGNALPLHEHAINDEVIEEAAIAVEAVVDTPTSEEPDALPEPVAAPTAPTPITSGEPDDWDSMFADELMYAPAE